MCGIRTTTAAEFTVPLDDDDDEEHEHGRARNRSPGPVQISQRNWGSSMPKPQSLIEPPPSVDVEPEQDDECDEGKHPGFLRQRIHRTPTPPPVAAHRKTIKDSFPQGWSPPHKLSRQAMDGLRVLHMHDPETFSTPVLAAKFRISPEAVRRVLKSKWEPSAEQRARLLRRELRDKEEWIRRRRVAEHEELQMLEKDRIREHLKNGHTVGSNSKDSLSLV